MEQIQILLCPNLSRRRSNHRCLMMLINGTVISRTKEHYISASKKLKRQSLFVRPLVLVKSTMIRCVNRLEEHHKGSIR